MAAPYRQVYTTFWNNDEYIKKLTPQERYFFLYLLTNSRVSFCGIYLLPVNLVTQETGLSVKTVTRLLRRFVEDGKVAYSKKTSEVCLCNWLKYNCNNSANQKKGIINSISDVADKELVKYLKGVSKIIPSEKEAVTEAPSQGDRQAIKHKTENIKQKTVVVEKSPENKFNFVQYFASKLIVPNEIFKDKLVDLGDVYPEPMLIEATEIYGKKGGQSINFLEAILKNLEKGANKGGKRISEQTQREVPDDDAFYS